MIERNVASRQAQASASLELRLAKVITNDHATSSEIVDIVTEVEAAIDQANQAVAALREKAIDIIESPDAAGAFGDVEAAEHRLLRMQKVLPRLKQKLATTLEADRHDRFLVAFNKARVERDLLAAEFSEVYVDVTAKLTDLFNRMQACDRKCGEVDSMASTLVNEYRRLGRVELVARGLGAFSRSDPEILKQVALPDFQHSDRNVWPQTRAGGVGLACAQMMSPPPPLGIGPDWSDPDVRETRRREIEKQQGEMAQHYAQMTKEQTERQNAELRERFNGRTSP